MSTALTIALDAMGGDNAPAVVVKGADFARRRFPDVNFHMFGDEKRLFPLMKRRKRLREITQITHTDNIISNEMNISTALRKGRQSSMQLAINSVRDGNTAGVVSAGNTGALMGMAKLALRTLPGIDRPAIAAILPTMRGESVMLDLGANVECDAENLIQFAIMGDVFARTVLGTVDPSCGLLNVGSEEAKGHAEIQQAYAYLRGMSGSINFHGFVEGDDIAAGTTDVIVSDGFSGNIALKTTEGTARLIKEFLGDAFRSSLSSRLGFVFARRGLRKMRDRIDPRRYNGAVFVGLTGIAVKSHGGTDAFGFANAIGVAVDMAAKGFNEKITEGLQNFSKMELVDREAAAS
ncbi:MAG: phosphate acyltransferase PlsX [Pseudomonadota bacterium]|nr:phosphate acyltransferase PlsX [Pseudomonadota bacterium]